MLEQLVKIAILSAPTKSITTHTGMKLRSQLNILILAPYGSGKTTLLRAVSGFLEPSEGRVLIGGKDMAGIGPNKRPTALIFQNLALFPLMSVADNIVFSLEVKGISKKERRKRADELLDLIATHLVRTAPQDFPDLRPHEYYTIDLPASN